MNTIKVRLKDLNNGNEEDMIIENVENSINCIGNVTIHYLDSEPDDHCVIGINERMVND